MADAETSRVHRRLIVHGRVQGVGYRAHVARLARAYPVSGHVRNLSDGTVEIEVQGPRRIVDQFIEEALTPSWPIHPGGIRRSEDLPVDTKLREFEVLRDQARP